MSNIKKSKKANTNPKNMGLTLEQQGFNIAKNVAKYVKDINTATRKGLATMEMLGKTMLLLQQEAEKARGKGARIQSKRLAECHLDNVDDRLRSRAMVYARNRSVIDAYFVGRNVSSFEYMVDTWKKETNPKTTKAKTPNNKGKKNVSFKANKDKDSKPMTRKELVKFITQQCTISKLEIVDIVEDLGKVAEAVAIKATKKAIKKTA